MVSATEEAQKLKAILARHGVQASIELQVGRPWSGDDWYSRKSVLVNHHTAGSNTGKTPSLALVKRGRGDALPGPLCNGYGGRDFIYRIITMGLANHPGEGGPLTVAGFTIPKDSARISTWGTEWEHDGVSSWPADMREFMGRSNAALCEYLGIQPARSIEHKTWAPSRKVDRNQYTAAIGRAEIRKWQTAGASVPVPAEQTEDDVSFSDTHKLTDADVRAYGADDLKVGDKKSYDEIVRFPPAVARLRREMAAQIGALTAVVARLADSIQDGGSLTSDQAAAAAAAGARAALAELGDLLDGDNDDANALPQSGA